MEDCSSGTRDSSDDSVDSDSSSETGQTSLGSRMQNKISFEVEIPLSEDEKVFVGFPQKKLRSGKGSCPITPVDTSFGVKFQNTKYERTCGSNEEES